VNDLIGYLVLLKIHANREQSFDELDGSHKWQDIKQNQDLIKQMQQELRDEMI